MSTTIIPVRVTYDRWRLALSPAEIRVRPGDDPRIQWVCRDADIEIRFPSAEESPFEGDRFHSSRGRGPVVPGTLRPGLTAKSRYPYLVVLLLEGKEIGRISGVLVVAEETETEAKIVEIRIQPDGTLVADPDKVRVNRPRDERVEWRCEGGDFVVRFDKEGSPFEDGIFAGSRAAPVRSGRWKTGSLEHVYDYSIRVWPDGGGAPIDLDPGVEVDDSGGSGG